MTVAEEVTTSKTVQHALDTLHHNGVRARYDNYYGGKFQPPVSGKYFTSTCPMTQEPIAEFAKSGPEDVEKAIDAAAALGETWARTPVAKRSAILLKIADKLEENLQVLAAAESLDNGKPIRETLNADIPLVIDHFRYFARRKAQSTNWTKTRSRITSRNPWESSGRSFPGTSRC